LFAGECGERPQDEIWLISSRHADCIASGADPALRLQRFDAGLGWQSAQLEEFCQPASPDQITVIFVHGNRVSPAAAVPEGRQVYQILVGRSSDAPPVRFVIWSWPSEQIRGQLRDVRVKAERTEAAGYCLGWLLAHLPENQRVSLLGYSFGARIATGAMHLVGGGELAGRVLPAHPLVSRNTRLVTIAGALHNGWLRPCGYHEQALTHLDLFLNVYNCCDPVLKRYHALYKHSHAVALGYAGMSTRDLGSAAGRVEQVDACQYVAHSHELLDYLHSSCLDERIRSVLFWSPASDNLASAQSSQVATDAAR
jgi:pimeloyl-ACP methyl ester carboxylesterase